MDIMEVEEIRAALSKMEADPTLITDSAYSADMAWAGNRMPFVDAHIAYLKAHPNVSARQYLANIRLRIKIR
jgi:hypothetical protein